MSLLLMIFGAVLVAFLIAFVIVKYLPLKLRWLPSIILLVAAIFLGIKIYDGIMEPIVFNKEKVKKYQPVVNSLKIIRDAQVKYYEVNGTYNDNKAGLIRFVDTARLALTETKTVVERVNTGTKYNPIYVDQEVRVTDTIGYEPVLKYFKDRDYKNMFKVPGVEGKEFEIEVGSIEKIPGLVVSTFRVRTPKADILKGMNESLIKQELEVKETNQIRGEYVSVGSLEEISTGGNWPPSYDKSKGAKKQ
ncbi:hypothetical protein LPB03_00270 [Polaribacter vadi]|mgnify:FL=1|jgi:hypothetical protein|uniref:Uncharacterized protein n=1 Tax=Polaribacter vadi TaxID=1774273 RepID=A0A1B8TZS7_9FLAO|nr:PrgI family protein [Polaribacter vadi]AOW15985.1 hypothetical protein LPB03_00270 [Polaribacter vadi]OBY65106.1 hypothetical protein LPB3_04835 [Polaribacter vadi]